MHVATYMIVLDVTILAGKDMGSDGDAAQLGRKMLPEPDSRLSGRM